MIETALTEEAYALDPRAGVQEDGRARRQDRRRPRGVQSGQGDRTLDGVVVGSRRIRVTVQSQSQRAAPGCSPSTPTVASSPPTTSPIRCPTSNSGYFFAGAVFLVGAAFFAGAALVATAFFAGAAFLAGRPVLATPPSSQALPSSRARLGRYGLLGGRCLLRRRSLGARGLGQRGLLRQVRPSSPPPSWPAPALGVGRTSPAQAWRVTTAFLAGAAFLTAAAFLAGAALDATAFFAAPRSLQVPPSWRAQPSSPVPHQPPALDGGIPTGSFTLPAITDLNWAPGRNDGVDRFHFHRLAGARLRATRGARLRFSNTPNPVMVTFSPAARARSCR